MYILKQTLTFQVYDTVTLKYSRYPARLVSNLRDVEHDGVDVGI